MPRRRSAEIARDISPLSLQDARRSTGDSFMAPAQATIANLLPPIYRHLLGELLDLPVPTEPESTCSNCPMCEKSPKNALPVNKCFNNQTKCCTFFPKLPNYLVGAILNDAGLPEGQRRISGRLTLGHGVSPWGVVADGRYALLFANSKDGFGRSESLLCPYYQKDSGGCSVWTHREAVCSTFFCKHEGGKLGKNFWMAFKRYIILLEQRLAEYALMRVLPDSLPQQVDKLQESARTASLSREELDGLPLDPRELHDRFGSYAGRETDLYRDCHAAIASLKADDLPSILGVEGEIRRRALLKAHHLLYKEKIPTHAKFNSECTIRKLKNGSFQLVSYSKFNPLIVTESELAFLKDYGVHSHSNVTDLALKAYRYGILL
jgi:Fe-S-cluster containining protein